MTEIELRKNYVAVMKSWIGKSEGNGSHKSIIDIYNAQKDLPQGYKVKYTDAWCTTTVSAAAITAGLDKIFPIECSCPRMIELAKKMKIWVEKDNFIPDIGDLILYDWEDDGKGNNKGVADHIGVVSAIEGKSITVIEGNKNDRVEKRAVTVNQRYIRGYICPKYSSMAMRASKTESKKDENKSYGVGDVVTFSGTYQYSSSYSGAKKSRCKSGKAKITAVNKGAAHPYHLIRVSGNATVYGWVDAADIKELAKSEIKVGDVVQFDGTEYFDEPYANAKSKSCKGGPAKVVSVNKNAVYAFKIKHTTKASTVNGWVSAKMISK